MRILLVFWVIFIFICTCTNDVHALLTNLEIKFTFIQNPNWDSFLRLYPPTNVSSFEVTGHFLLFFVLTCLLLETTKNRGLVIVIAITFAIFTEVLQMYFSRGADLYDIIANTIGILVAVALDFIPIRRLLLGKR